MLAWTQIFQKVSSGEPGDIKEITKFMFTFIFYFTIDFVFTFLLQYDGFFPEFWKC